ncbi:TetR/AcrR family transcriptional regulator [Spirillospora sp. CA-294931]|uniref:TetR/AcrR family transcriptional regulator n=1 Tax=Spirillospora sp. CA-294931 TaxID=3240042 RepID=UPI003D89CDAC
MNGLDGTAQDQDQILALLWGGPRERARGPKPTITVPDIARAAVAIADVQGIDAVLMQTVAAELGVTKMALYRYVHDKNGLLAVMIEEAVDDPPDLSGVGGGWRPRVEEFTRLLSVVWTRHPWLPWLTIGDRPMGPREVGWVECAIGALDDTGLRGNERLDAAFMIFGHIRTTMSLTTAGTQPWTSDRNSRPPMQRLLYENSERYPALTAAMDEVTPAPAQDQGRAFGLTCILDGLEVLIRSRLTS